MAFNHTLSAVLRGRWLLNPEWAMDHLPLVMLMMEGKNVNFNTKSNHVSNHIDLSSREESGRPYFIEVATGKKYNAFVYDYQTERVVPNANIPANSVAVLSITGPITKYDGECGEPGAISIANTIADLSNRDATSAIVLVLDTPGGEARGASALVNGIQNSKKPVIGYVNGMCASLGVWASSACKEVYVSDEMDQMGSVGSYCSFMDFRGYLEKNGVKLHEIYAPQSTDKNKEYRDALNGDYSGIEEELKLHVDAFINFVSTARGEKATKNAAKWNSGKMFMAKDAVEIGLANGIMPLHKVISRAAFLSNNKK